MTLQLAPTRPPTVTGPHAEHTCAGDGGDLITVRPGVLAHTDPHDYPGCRTPEAAMCQHYGCHAPARVDLPECPNGHLHCCGECGCLGPDLLED